MTLTEAIEARIREIPTSNPAYISVVPETLKDLLSRNLLRKIAETAADVALTRAQDEAK